MPRGVQLVQLEPKGLKLHNRDAWRTQLSQLKSGRLKLHNHDISGSKNVIKPLNYYKHMYAFYISSRVTFLYPKNLSPWLMNRSHVLVNSLKVVVVVALQWKDWTKSNMKGKALICHIPHSASLLSLCCCLFFFFFLTGSFESMLIGW